jgi:hypothetical protein
MTGGRRNRYDDSVPRFFFHVHDSLDAPDEEGREFASAEEACATAIAEARCLVAAEALTGRIGLNHHIVVVDESGAIVSDVRFKDAVVLED